MLIFDEFPNRAAADEFAVKIRSEFDRSVVVYDDVKEAQAVDPFPFGLTAPVVHVSRRYEFTDRDIADETAIVESVSDFGGQFAGT